MIRRNFAKFVAGLLVSVLCVTSVPTVTFADNLDENIEISLSENEGEDIKIEDEVLTFENEAEDIVPEDEVLTSENVALELNLNDIDSDMEENGLGYVAPDFEAPISYGSNSYSLNAELPSSYNSVKNGYVTSVKDQGSYGVCWAFAMCGAAETSMLKQKYVNDNTAVDYSERQLAYFMYNRKGINDPLGNTAGDYVTATSDWKNVGGNATYSSMMLKNYAGGMGREEDDPYSGLASGVNADKCYVNLAHLQQVRFINSASKESIKQYIISNGSVVAALRWEERYLNDAKNAFFCNDEDSQTNHQILLVGYDDSFSKDNFRSGSKPQSDGAWLVKNSWGTSRFDGGYLWVSYEDMSLNEFVALEYEPAGNYENNYHYDGGVNWGGYGYSSGDATNKKYTMAANVFKAAGNEKLEAVGVCFYSADVEYSIQIYKQPQNGKPDSGTAMLSEPLKGKTTEAGFYTVKLNQSVFLDEGDTFSVVVKAHADDEYTRLAYDITQEFGFCTNHTGEIAGTSFLKSGTATAWTDASTTKDGSMTFRINAYTNKVSKSVMSVDKTEAFAGDYIEASVQFDDLDVNICDVDLGVYTDEACTTMAGSDLGVNVKEIIPDSKAGGYKGVISVSINAIPGNYYLRASYGTVVKSTNVIKLDIKALYAADFKAEYACYEDTDWNREHNIYSLSYLNSKTGEKVLSDNYVSFTSSNESIAEVYRNGTVKVKSEGTTTISVILDDGAQISGDLKVVEIKDDSARLDSEALAGVFTNVYNKVSDLNDILDDTFGKNVWVIENEDTDVVADDANPVQEFVAYHIDSNTGFRRQSEARFKVFAFDNFVLKNVKDVISVGETIDDIEIGYDIIGAKPQSDFFGKLSTTYEKIGNAFYLYENNENGRVSVKGISTGDGNILATLKFRSEDGLVEIGSARHDFKIEVGDAYKGTFVKSVGGNDSVISINRTYEYDLDLGEDSIETNKNIFKFKYSNYSGNVTLSVKDAGVLKIGTNDKTKKEVTLIPKSFGSTVLTVTYDDLNKTQMEYKVRVLSKSAKSFSLSNETLNFNSALKSDVKTIEVLNACDAWLQNVELVDANGNPVSGYSVSFSSAYKDECVQSKISIGLNGAGKNMTAYLRCSWGIYSTDYHGEDISFKVNLKVAKTVPKVTAKLTKKPNAFLRGNNQMSADNPAAGLVAINCSGAGITGVRLNCANSKPFGFTGFVNNSSAVNSCEMPILVGDATLIKNNKAFAAVTLDGYRDPIKVNFTIDTISGTPTFNTSAVTLYKGNKETETAFVYVIDKKSGQVMNINPSYVALADASMEEYYSLQSDTESGNPGIRIKLLKGVTKNKSGDTLKIKVVCDDWRYDIGSGGEFTLSIKVSVKDLSKLTLKLTEPRVNMYVYQGANARVLNSAVYSSGISLAGGCTDTEFVNALKIEEVSKTSTYGNTILVENNDGQLNFKFNSARNVFPAAGTYKYRFTLPKDLIGSKKDISATISLKVKNVADVNDVFAPSKCVSIKTKGKIDVLNRVGSFVTVTPKFSNLPKSMKLRVEPQIGGLNKDLFEIAGFDADNGTVNIALIAGKKVSSGVKYTINLSYKIYVGELNYATVTTKDFNVSLTQGKVSTSVNSDTYNYSNASHGNVSTLTINTVHSSGIGIAFYDAKLLSGTDDFSIVEVKNNNVILNHNPSGLIKKNKSYVVKVSLKLKDAFENSKPVVVNYKVKIQ